ncbi:MAG TPA: hypothetical protein VIN73_11910 [Vicingaceae bacterium]
MVRVVQDEQQKKEPVALDQPSLALFRLLGVVVADQPEQLSVLLKKYGIKLPDYPKKTLLTEAAIYAISKKNNEFNYDLAQLLASQRIPENADSFIPDALIRYAVPKEATVKPSAEQFIATSLRKPFVKRLSTEQLQQLKQQAQEESLKSTISFQTHQQLIDKQEDKVDSSENKQNDENSSEEKTPVALKIVGIMGIMGVVAFAAGIVISGTHKNKATLINPAA